MPRTKGKEHKYCRECFDKTIESLKDKKIDMYALFYRGFRTGVTYQRKEESSSQN